MDVADPETTFRLGRTVVPSRYDLTLIPDLDAGRFSGSETVTVTVFEPVEEVVLNAKDLTVGGGWLEGEGQRIEVASVRHDAATERVVLDLARLLDPGEWTLHLAFEAPLNDKMTGFYRSNFEDADGVERVIAATHHEATDARMTFPCWDEPDLKAVFGVTVEVAEGLTVLSNGPEVSREPAGEGTVRVRFADTMTMSTYLLCVVVGPLVLTEPRDASGTPSRVACRPGKEHLASYALEVSAFCLDWFAEYYGIPYPDAKVDHVALPDFAQGAMENLGCITYRETLLLVDEDASTQAERLEIVETVAHELAHMWFGDLVTMRWWNGIWLNEAFATFMSFLAVDAMHPQWRVWDTFARIRSTAFEVDALESTRPIEYEVRSPDDASGMFDTLTYTKGGSVLRMLEQWLGPERFRDGIRRYLRTHAYANTETHDLWDALEKETGEPVRRVADAWIFQRGYPAVSVTRDGDMLRFSQRRFAPSLPDDATTWPVPLIVRQAVPGGTQVDHVLIEAEGATLPLATPDAVVVANAEGSSFVRVFYDDDLRARLLARVMTDLSPVERQCLVDDAWAAVLAGDAPASGFVDLALGFSEETDLSVWRAILTGLGWCDRFVEGDARERFRDEVRGLVRPALERLGWEALDDDTDLDRELRGELVRALGILAADPEAQAQSREIEAGSDADAPVVAAAVDVVAFAGGPEEHARYRRIARDGTTPQEQERYRSALPRFGDPELMARTLDACLTDEIRPQDAPFVLSRALSHRDLGEQAWAFVANRWDDIERRFAASNMIALPAGARYLTDPATARGVQAFFETHDIPQSHLMLTQFLERLRIAAALRERAEPDLAARLSG